MKHKPQTLTSGRRWLPAAIFAALLASVVLVPALPVLASVTGQLAAGQQATTKQAPDEQTAAKETPPVLKASTEVANDVLSKVTSTLKGAQSLSCNIQQTILMSGQKMLAAGRYVQGTGNRMRLEYRIFPVEALHSKDAALLKPDAEAGETEIADEKISGALTQISDGSVLWSKWQNGPDTQITRRNIREILDAVKDIKNTTAADSLRSLGIGGLQTLISQLQVGMEFGQVKEQTIAGNTVYVLTGRWSQKTRKDIFQVPEGDLNTPLPAYIPDYVRVYVDQKASLPRRIEYLKRHPNPEVKQAQPLAILDFRNIRLNEALNEAMFDISKEESDDSVEEKDLTRDVIDAIKAASETAAPKTDANPADAKTSDSKPTADGSTEGK